ncbi:hypothetical protein BRD18_08265 [Halobacteriales archaeon SW_7_71_33]|nr:MAG: hypothetical protein BRD18_08265 [Halobacteriales archaeon SW_7_71_33]
MAEYYDYVLAFVPVALFGVGGGLFAAGASVVVAVVAASGVVLGIIGHATFVNAPGESGTPGTDTDPDTTPADSTAARPADRARSFSPRSRGRPRTPSVTA